MPQSPSSIPPRLIADDGRVERCTTVDRGGRRPPVVLLASGVSATRSLMGPSLRDAGFIVSTAATSGELWQLLDGQRFDIVLLEPGLPDVSAVACIHALRTRFERLTLPVVLLTKPSQRRLALEGLAAGANDFIAKPVDMAVLAARLERQRSLSQQGGDGRAGEHLAIRVGSRIAGRYDLRRLIGTGGFGAVFEAWDRRAERIVAVKLQRADVDESLLAWFAQEVRATSTVDHPHLVRFVDAGQTIGVPPTVGETSAVGSPSLSGVPQTVRYLVTEFLRGETLAQRLRRGGRLDPQEAVDLFLPVVDALAYAHDRGILHRDIKPSNVFLAQGQPGRPFPVVLDFGAAKLVDGAAHPSITREVVGTPQYLSPEQAAGCIAVDARSDQYALAVALYECLTGCPAFRLDSTMFELVERIRGGRAPSVMELRPDLPPALGRAIARAMQPDRDARFESMRAWGAALLGFASPEMRASYATRWSTGPQRKASEAYDGPPTRRATPASPANDDGGALRRRPTVRPPARRPRSGFRAKVDTAKSG